MSGWKTIYGCAATRLPRSAQRSGTVAHAEQFEDIDWVGWLAVRFYNPNTGEHLYSTNYQEQQTLQSIGWKREGNAWLNPKSQVSAYSDHTRAHHYTSKDVYRLYNPNAKGGDHFYTTNAGERDSLIRAGWKYDGIVFRIFNKEY